MHLPMKRKKAQKTQSEGVRYTLRLPKSLVDTYKSRAADAQRSTSGEMIHVLRLAAQSAAN